MKAFMTISKGKTSKSHGLAKKENPAFQQGFCIILDLLISILAGVAGFEYKFQLIAITYFMSRFYLILSGFLSILFAAWQN